ncbi:MAG: Mur ligase domain-containing protein [bacterium]
MKHVHFMGIGGSGVSGLALMAAKKGYKVSGCDAKTSSYLEMVKSNGIDCSIGHSAKHVEGVDIIVRSSAIPFESEEIQKALDEGVEVVSRGSFLAQLVKEEDVIGIAGSHGKTSVSWMLYHILKKMGLSPSLYSGGTSNGVSTVFDKSPFIVELDESDGSMFEIKPKTLVITNLEFEHPDFYLNSAEMLKSFERYLLQWQPETLIIGKGYSLSDALLSTFSATTFPSQKEIKEGNSFQNTSGYDFFWKKGELFISFENGDAFVGALKEPFHLIQNRSAALLAAFEFLKKREISFPDIDFATLWEEMPTVERRFQIVKSFKGVDLVDDYAHHPSELKALMAQAELKYGNFCLVFQPHRTSRFTIFYNEFLDVLKYAEPLIILPVYKAGENLDGANSLKLYNELSKNCSNIHYFETVQGASRFLKENIESLRVTAVVAAGAGDLNKIFDMLEGQ